MIQSEIQYACKSTSIPDEGLFIRWVEAALEGKKEDAEIVIRIVDEHESASLNNKYRHKTGPTNALSFPFEAPEGIDMNLLGDLVICAPVVEREADEQDKSPENHWAHMVVHGVLHLLGFDHVEDSEAERMESAEIKILDKLNIKNPYDEVEHK